MATPSFPCVILAGGLATRMRPHTQNLPKALIPVGGTPFLEYQLQWLESQGVKDVLISVGYLAEHIREYISRRPPAGLKIQFVEDGPLLRGTGGALQRVLETTSLEAFFVMYGDSFLPISFRDVQAAFREKGKPALMTVFRNEEKWDTSNVRFENGTLSLYIKRAAGEKLEGVQFIDYGLSVLTRKVVQAFQPGKVAWDLAELLHPLSVKGDLAGYEVFERFYEIGSPGGLADFEAYASKYYPELFGANPTSWGQDILRSDSNESIACTD